MDEVTSNSRELTKLYIAFFLIFPNTLAFFNAKIAAKKKAILNSVCAVNHHKKFAMISRVVMIPDAQVISNENSYSW